MSNWYKLIISVDEIKGKCPVYKLGDKMVIEGPRIKMEETDSICIHALGCISTFISALSNGISPQKLGLSRKDENVGHFQCLDPGAPFTDGGTVIFKIIQEPSKD